MDNIMSDRAAFVVEPAWHRKGTTHPQGTTLATAIQSIRLSEIVVETKPMLVDLGGMQIACDQKAIVRMPVVDDDQYRIFGYCKSTYQVLQHKEIADKLEKLAETWPVETIGLLGHGETMFLTLDAGIRDVKGDPVHQYFLVSATLDGETGISLHFTPVRVVCQNTLTLGKSAAIASTNLRHTQSVGAELDQHLELIRQFQQVADKVLGQFELMAEVALDVDGFGRILSAAYPYPRKPRKVELGEVLTVEQMAASTGLLFGVKEAENAWASAKERADERRVAATEMFLKFNDEQKNLANTPWSAYNAVVEVEDYRNANRKEDVGYSAVWGLRAANKERAFAQAWKETLGVGV